MVLGFSGGSDSKESACNAGDPGWSLGWEDPLGEGNGSPFQCSCLENYGISAMQVYARSVMSDSSWLRGLQPTRLLCSWNFSGMNTGVGSHFLVQGIF